jgi:hypothetical protein
MTNLESELRLDVDRDSRGYFVQSTSIVGFFLSIDIPAVLFSRVARVDRQMASIDQ